MFLTINTPRANTLVNAGQNTIDFNINHVPFVSGAIALVVEYANNPRFINSGENVSAELPFLVLDKKVPDNKTTSIDNPTSIPVRNIRGNYVGKVNLPISLGNSYMRIKMKSTSGAETCFCETRVLTQDNHIEFTLNKVVVTQKHIKYFKLDMDMTGFDERYHDVVVEVCNNAKDVKPVWEDISGAFKAGTYGYIVNRKGIPALNVRVTILNTDNAGTGLKIRNVYYSYY